MTQTNQIDLFLKDLKRLRKRYPSIDKDLTIFAKALLVRLPDKLPDTYRIPLGKEYETDPVFKTKSFSCKSLGGGKQSGIRLIYAYNDTSEIVTFIEIYHKNEKTNHDADRITAFLKSEFNPSNKTDDVSE
jgi:mRNA-degrading endonuclease RelE of RelBE toxin-antitoxin system